MNMDEQANVARSKTSQSSGLDRVLAVLSAAAGAFVLWLTSYFYRDVFNVPTIDWLGLIQPALMITGGVMGLVGAALSILGHTVGRDVLKLAWSILPLILAMRLLVLLVRLIIFMVGWTFNNADGIIDGTAFVDVRLSPLNIANIVVLVALVVYLSVRNRTRRTQAPGTRNDTR